MFYAAPTIELAREFMQSGNGSYSQLANLLQRIYPRTDTPWTRHSAYHLCRTNGISSKRRCKSQPSAGNSQRRRTREHIISATLAALSAASKTINDIAPVQLKEIVRLSGAPLYNVRNNWHDLANELNALAGLPKALRIIED
jgi:hypothetical protein